MTHRKKESDAGQKKSDVPWDSIIEHLTEIAPDLIKEYFDNKEKDREHERRAIEMTGRHNRRLIYALLAFAGGILAFMGFLALNGTVSGDGLLFAVGTALGTIVTLIYRLFYDAIHITKRDGIDIS